MKLTKKQINHFNTPGTLLVISSYPPRGHKYATNQDTLAGFTKNRVSALKSPTQLVVILAPIISKPETFIEDDILVIRCFKKNNPLSWINILRNTARFNLTQNILIEFEFATLGDIWTTIAFPILLLMLKTLGKKITIELHQVLLDINKLSGHIGHSKFTITNSIFNIGLNLFYKILGLLSDNLIVLEQNLKSKLKKRVREDKISVIPHGVDIPKHIPTKKQARKNLNLKQDDFIVTTFGYITWYKGTDLIIKTFNHPSLAKRKNIKLIIAGGPSFTQKDKPHYQNYYQKVLDLAGANKNVTITGFVNETDIKNYYSASDLIVLPYRTFMSSSGPLSLALSYKKPFILSRRLKKYLKSPDFKIAQHKSGLKTSDLISNLNPEELSAKILEANNKDFLNKLSNFSKTLRSNRSYKSLAHLYHPLLRITPKINFAPIELNKIN